MKVKDFLKKVNYASAKTDVYLAEGVTGKQRKAVSFDFNGYFFPEEDRTVASISLLENKVIVYYK